MAYDNSGRLGLWRNRDRKEQTHPHLTGQGEDLNGNAVWVSAWFSKDLSAGDQQVLTDMVKRYEGTSTKPFINVVTRIKEQRQPSNDTGNGQASQQSNGTVSGQAGYPVDNGFDDGFDDDIPF